MVAMLHRLLEGDRESAAEISVAACSEGDR